MDSNENFTQNHSEAILEYLRKQGEQPGESGCFFKEKSPSEDVRDILKDLLDKIETRQALKEEYEFKVTQHNQYPLFKLSEKISYFIIGEFYVNNSKKKKESFNEKQSKHVYFVFIQLKSLQNNINRKQTIIYIYIYLHKGYV